jgi:hypothetical protein
MSLETCVLCKCDATPWSHVVGHLCENCHHQVQIVTEIKVLKKDIEMLARSFIRLVDEI